MPQAHSPLTLLLFLGLALLAGIATAFQPGVNAAFAAHTGSRWHGALVNFSVGLLTIVVVYTLLRVQLPTTDKLTSAPWWAWIGGVLGVFFVSMSILVVPRIGAVNYFAAIIAGQFIGSLIIDHLGLMGLSVHTVSPGRILGILLIIAGVACVRLF